MRKNCSRSSGLKVEVVRIDNQVGIKYLDENDLRKEVREIVEVRLGDSDKSTVDIKIVKILPSNFD
ncbi:MAG: hypothetical protein NZM26_03105 [Patescibacteria group bacterium]|nr:hypothetical protein [Patescibacteria group bacterium]